MLTTKEINELYEKLKLYSVNFSFMYLYCSPHDRNTIINNVMVNLVQKMNEGKVSKVWKESEGYITRSLSNELYKTFNKRNTKRAKYTENTFLEDVSYLSPITYQPELDKKRTVKDFCKTLTPKRRAYFRFILRGWSQIYAGQQIFGWSKENSWNHYATLKKDLKEFLTNTPPRKRYVTKFSQL